MKKLLLVLTLCLLWLASAQAMVTTGEEQGDNYTAQYPLVYLTNGDAQEAINADIATYVDAFREAMASGYFVRGKTSYKIWYEDDKVLSLTFLNYKDGGGTHGMGFTYGMVYDKNTGARLPLSNFLKITPAQLDNEVTNNAYSLYGGKKITYARYSRVKTVPTNYFLAGHGVIYPIFQSYELFPYAAGVPCIRIAAARANYYNRINS